MSQKEPYIKQLVAQNKKARYEYFLEETEEAGLVLTGSEVKSLRSGKGSIMESYVDEVGGELMLLGSHIPEYSNASGFGGHEPLRPRKLLLHKRQMDRFLGLIRKKGCTIVPLRLYFNKKNLAKLEIAVATGKKKHDKREAIKERDWDRRKAKLMRE
jgi:SsrA-binding protein